MNPRRGSALMLALVTIVLFSALMVSFLFRVEVESDLAVRHRFGHKAAELARSGLEVAKWMLATAPSAGNEPDEDMSDEFFLAAKHLQRGVPVRGYTMKTRDGTLTLNLRSESALRNVNQLSDADWEALLENAGVPEERTSELIDTFRDWTDQDQATRLQGAEEDDAWYDDRGLPVKNGPIDHLEELAQIKGFTRALLYGGTLEDYFDEPDLWVDGIASRLTVYGDDHIQINAAPREVLMSLSGIRENEVEEILQGRAGKDGVFGTEDDGYESTEDAVRRAGLSGGTASLFTTAGMSVVRVTSVGEVAGVRRTVEVVLELNGRDVHVLSYREGN